VSACHLEGGVTILLIELSVEHFTGKMKKIQVDAGWARVADALRSGRGQSIFPRRTGACLAW
jgi:hypothetical protein